MNLSIDTPSDDARDIRQALASWLDDYIDGRCDRAGMTRGFLDVGRSHPEAPWDALALLDQYQRLGRLDAVLVRELKGAIAQLVFGPSSQPLTGRLAGDEGTLDQTSDEHDAFEAPTDDVVSVVDQPSSSSAVRAPADDAQRAEPLSDVSPEGSTAGRVPAADVAREMENEASRSVPPIRRNDAHADAHPHERATRQTDPNHSVQDEASPSVARGISGAVRAQSVQSDWRDAKRRVQQHQSQPSDRYDEARHPQEPVLSAGRRSKRSGSATATPPFIREDAPPPLTDDPVTVWPAAARFGAEADASDRIHIDAVRFADAAALNDESHEASSGAGTVMRPALQSLPPVAGAQSLNLGDVLRGRYELLSVLGRGSTGIVYQALDRHRAHLTPEARQVAVKVLAGDYRNSPALLARLETEFHQAQSLSHPNVTRIFDLDRDGETYFIVMELLQGELLSELKARLRGHPMQQHHALAIISAVGAALAHAHRRGIVHGDVRPENIMITRQGEVRVLDFGFAGAQAPQLHSAAAMPLASRTHAAYASVERANGSEPHASDDVYSLACIAYELLSGRHPFGGRSAPLARAHGRQPRRIAGLNSRQMQVLHRALLWARGERSIDVVELLAGLGCGEAPAQLGTLEELAQPADGGGRHRWVIAALIFLLAAALAAAWWFFDGAVPGSSATPVPLAPPPQVVAPSSPPVPNEVAPDVAIDEGTAPDAAPVQRDVIAPPLPSAAEPSSGAVEARSSARMPVIEFDKDTYVVSEGDGAVRLLIRRTGSLSREVTFSWVLRPNSAHAGSDYADIGPGVERIPAGVREVGLSIPLVQDAMKEGTEMFLAQLQVEDDMAQLGERSSAAIIIVDDD